MKLILSLIFILLTPAAFAKTVNAKVVCGTTDLQYSFNIAFQYDDAQAVPVYTNPQLSIFLIGGPGGKIIMPWTTQENLNKATGQTTLTFTSKAQDTLALDLPADSTGITLKRTKNLIDSFKVAASGEVNGKTVTIAATCNDSMSLIK